MMGFVALAVAALGALFYIYSSGEASCLLSHEVK